MSNESDLQNVQPVGGQSPFRSILYHYTSTKNAESIAKTRIIKRGCNGVLLTSMEPEKFFRSEILVNYLENGMRQEEENRADYCVKVQTQKLDYTKLDSVNMIDGRDVFLYQDDIKVEETDVFDKPRCERANVGTPYAGYTATSQGSSYQHNFSPHIATSATNLHNFGNKIIKIRLRNDQTLDDRQRKDFQDESVTIFAPEWVSEGLDKIQESIGGKITCSITDRSGNHVTKEVDGKLTLKELQIIARNEGSNTSGRIDFSLYENIPVEVVLSIKDLVRQCVIVGRDTTSHYGGYPQNCKRVPQESDVYVCDLIGLQFQNDYNTGRLVLIANGTGEGSNMEPADNMGTPGLPKGILDDFIYEKVVGEKRPSLSQASNDRSRFIPIGTKLFDSKAYIKFVANDVLLSGLALDQSAHAKINFKFLKYGCGYFAGPYRSLLDSLIGRGVAEGLALLLPRQTMIGSIELPFFNRDPMIEQVCEKNKIELKYSNEDALKQTHSRYITATTNCADPHAVTGNRMGFGSIDGAIAENLRRKAKIFSCVINQLIKQTFIK